jgi:hypothetical protein
MAKLFEANEWTSGTFSVSAHDTKGVTLISGKHFDGTQDHLTAPIAVEAAIKFADTNKIGLDKWSFYVEGESQKREKKETQLPTSVWKKAEKAGYELTCEMGKWSKPRLTLRPKGGTKTTTKKIVTIIA